MTAPVTLPSPHPYQQTVARLDAELHSRCVEVFARIDHAANARVVA